MLAFPFDHAQIRYDFTFFYGCAATLTPVHCEQERVLDNERTGPEYLKRGQKEEKRYDP